MCRKNAIPRHLLRITERIVRYEKRVYVSFHGNDKSRNGRYHGRKRCYYQCWRSFRHGRLIVRRFPFCFYKQRTQVFPRTATRKPVFFSFCFAICFAKSQPKRQQLDSQSEIHEHGAHVHERRNERRGHDGGVHVQFLRKDGKHRA